MSELWRQPGELKGCKIRRCSGESVGIFPLVVLSGFALTLSAVSESEYPLVKILRNQQKETRAAAKATLSPREIEEVTSVSHNHEPG